MKQHVPSPAWDRLKIVPHVEPIEFIPCSGGTPDARPCRDRIMIYSVHGGDVIPSKFFEALSNLYPDEETCHSTILRDYATEKDWGANQVAESLARELGLAGYWRVNIARALMDFGRFPGITPPGASHLNRFAINYPFSFALDFSLKKSLLEQYYDPISDVFERETPGKVIALGIHSYDYRDPTFSHIETGSVRPDLSLIFRSSSSQELEKMPFGIFDRLYPEILAECTADRKLTARISLTLEKAGLAVSANYPYSLPNGSIEVRSQVWSFFKYLRDLFEAVHPDSVGDPSFDRVWTMLLDTNLRSSASVGLRSYLHMFRQAPRGRGAIFKQAQVAYQQIADFFNHQMQAIVDKFRTNPCRLTTLALEVRKDLIWHFNDQHTREPLFGPDGVRHQSVRRIAGLLAESIDVYFKKDRTSLPPLPFTTSERAPDGTNAEAPAYSRQAGERR